MVEDELDQAKIVFDNQVNAASRKKQLSGKNMPSVAGILQWSHQLRLRYQNPVNYLKMSVNQK